MVLILFVEWRVVAQPGKHETLSRSIKLSCSLNPQNTGVGRKTKQRKMWGKQTDIRQGQTLFFFIHQVFFFAVISVGDKGVSVVVDTCLILLLQI